MEHFSRPRKVVLHRSEQDEPLVSFRQLECNVGLMMGPRTMMASKMRQSCVNLVHSGGDARLDSTDGLGLTNDDIEESHYSQGTFKVDFGTE